MTSMIQEVKAARMARATSFDANFHASESRDPKRARAFAAEVKAAVVKEYGDRQVAIETLAGALNATASEKAGPDESWLTSLISAAVELWSETARVSHN